MSFPSPAIPEGVPEPSQKSPDPGTLLTTKNTHTPRKIKILQITPYYQLVRFLLNYAVLPSVRSIQVVGDSCYDLPTTRHKSSTTHSTLSVTYDDLTLESDRRFGVFMTVVTLESSHESNRR